MFVVFNLLEMAPSVLDHRWTQDGDVLSSVWNKWDLISAKESQKLRFDLFNTLDKQIITTVNY